MNKKIILFIVLLVLLVSSCAPRVKEVNLTVSKRLMDFPSGLYQNVVFIEGDIVGFIFNKEMPIGEQLFWALEGDSKPIQFIPEVDQACVHYEFFLVVGILPDGRLGLIKECVDKSGPTHFLSTERSIHAYDWNTGELERLVEGELSGRSHVRGFTWNPEMTLGVMEDNSYWEGTLYWIDRNGETPMDIEISDRGLTWNLKDRAEEAEHAGLANDPAWSSDGQTIAFFATSYGIQKQPLPKYDLKDNLFLMDAIELEPKLELTNIANSYRLYWSPDSQYLLFSGCAGRKFTCGLWRYKLIDQTLSLIDEGAFSDFTWVSNKVIIAAKDINWSFQYNEIWEYTIQE